MHNYNSYFEIFQFSSFQKNQRWFRRWTISLFYPGNPGVIFCFVIYFLLFIFSYAIHFCFSANEVDVKTVCPLLSVLRSYALICVREFVGIVRVILDISELLVFGLKKGIEEIFEKIFIFCLHIRHLSYSFYIDRILEVITWHDRNQTKRPNRLISMLS